MERMTFSKAWNTGPGPRSVQDAVIVTLKGFCMGAADIIPGVSGGTIAFITGIYEELLAAIKSFDITFFSRLARLDIIGALAEAHARFLAALLGGLLLAVVLMSRVMHYLLTNHPVHIWSLFFGLIAASIWVVGRSVGRFGPAEVASFVFGTVASWLLVGVVPVATPEALWFVLACGALAVCAMILPGISGAYILLLLGKYEFITRTLKNPFADGNLLILGVFALGCCVGIMSFSRLLHHMLVRHRRVSVSLLTGFMLGALRKVWPWKEVLESKVVHGKALILREANVAPGGFGADFALAVGLMVAGVLLVLALERMGRGQRA